MGDIGDDVLCVQTLVRWWRFVSCLRCVVKCRGLTNLSTTTCTPSTAPWSVT